MTAIRRNRLGQPPRVGRIGHIGLDHRGVGPQPVRVRQLGLGGLDYQSRLAALDSRATVPDREHFEVSKNRLHIDDAKSLARLWTGLCQLGLDSTGGWAYFGEIDFIKSMSATVGVGRCTSMKLQHALVTITVGCLGLAACTSAQEAQKTSTKPAASNGGTKTIGLITFSGTDPSANIVVSSAKKKAQEAGYEVVVVDAQGQVDQANTAMQNLVQRKVSGIAITVFPVSSLAAGLASTKQAGIPVVTSGGGTGDGIAVNVDDSQGEKVAQALIDNTKGGEGEALTLTYLGGRPCQLRLASFDKTVKANAPSLKVTRQAITVPGQVESATSATLAWLAAHPANSAASLSIYACFDDPALGAIAALKQTQRADVKVYSFNGIAPALAAVKEGTMTATLWFDQSAVGSTLVEVLDKSVKSGVSSTSDQVPAPSILVFKNNYDSFVTAHPDAIKAG